MLLLLENREVEAGELPYFGFQFFEFCFEYLFHANHEFAEGNLQEQGLGNGNDGVQVGIADAFVVYPTLLCFFYIVLFLDIFYVVGWKLLGSEVVGFCCCGGVLPNAVDCDLLFARTRLL